MTLLFGATGGWRAGRSGWPTQPHSGLAFPKNRQLDAFSRAGKPCAAPTSGPTRMAAACGRGWHADYPVFPAFRPLLTCTPGENHFQPLLHPPLLA